MAKLDSFQDVLVLFVIVGGLIAFEIIRPKRKNKVLTAEDVAKQLGLKCPTTKPEVIGDEFAFINRMQYGKAKHLSNIMSGRYKSHEVWAFNLRYETYSMTSGNSYDDCYSFFILKLPKAFPEMTIYPESIVSKLYQKTGHNDIDLESHEFSRKFRVRSNDPKFAYGFCNARMEELLLKHPDLGVEIDRNYLCISQNRLVPLNLFEYHLDSLVEMRSLMPEYLF